MRGGDQQIHERLRGHHNWPPGIDGGHLHFSSDGYRVCRICVISVHLGYTPKLSIDLAALESNT